MVNWLDMGLGCAAWETGVLAHALQMCPAVPTGNVICFVVIWLAIWLNAAGCLAGVFSPCQLEFLAVALESCFDV